MAHSGDFQPGNQFWQLRSKHGRDTLFASAGLLWQAACEYFQWCIDNPLPEVQYVGKDAMRVEIPKMRPFTMQGLCRYLDCNTGYFNDFNPPDSDFSTIVTRIRETVYEQKFTGAASGFLNPNIIARDLGLRDTTATELTGKNGGPIQTGIDYDALDTETLMKIAAARKENDRI